MKAVVIKKRIKKTPDEIRRETYKKDGVTYIDIYYRGDLTTDSRHNSVEGAGGFGEGHLGGLFQQGNGRPDLGALGNLIRSRAGSDFSKNLFERYWLGGGDVGLTQNRFLMIWDEIYRVNPRVFDRKGRKIVLENGVVVFAKTVNFYGSQEYSTAFGRATVFFDTNNTPVGLYDYYDFNDQDWGKRSFSNETKTRMVNDAGAFKGAKPFRITYGVVPSKYLE